MTFVTTDDGVRLHCEEAGAGTPMIFVHEFAGDHRSWEPQIRFFSRRYRCIVYSARGYPPSDVPDPGADYSQERVWQDLRCVMDGLHIHQAHLVGLSMGAFACLHFGLHHGTDGAASRALSLTLGGCGTGSHPAVYEAFKAQSQVLAHDIETLGADHLANTYGMGPSRLQLKAKDPRGYDEFNRNLAEHSALGSARTSRGYQGQRPSLYALTDVIAQINVPTLIMTGDEDEPCLEPSLLLKRTITTSVLAVLPGSGHAINLEEPQLFNQFLADFLAQVEQGKDFVRPVQTRPATIWGPGGDPRL
jgi:pimeloyl-ACP methyl ester carboxylesterase